MKLQVFRQMSYISPSSFLKWRSCQYKIYLQRLAGLSYIPDPQSVAAAIGSVFDAQVKHVIIKRKGFQVPFTAANLIKSNLTVQGDDRKESLERSLQFVCTSKCGGT